MKKMIKLAGIVAVAVAMTQTLQAVPITGNIGFTGAVTFDTSSAATATQVTSWVSPTTVTLTSGAFTGLNGAIATFANAVWNFGGPLPGSGVGLPINNFWSVGGFTFNLLSSYVLSQGGTPGVNGFVVVDGTGVVSGPAGSNYDPTVFSWSFTSQDPAIAGANGPSWTFSASANPNGVPDGGTTVMLLGIALAGAALLKKKLTA
jgi:hypothetical protein